VSRKRRVSEKSRRHRPYFYLARSEFFTDQDRFESGLFLDLESVFFTMCIGLIASIVAVVK